MSESARMWMEVTFNIAYLIVVWTLVILMIARREVVAPENRKVARWITWAFALLALGDTGHVGFRVIGYALGDMEATFPVLGMQVSWVGLGALATAYTVTVFYMLALLAWKDRFEKPPGWFGWALIAAGIARLIFMALPVNDWNRAVPPQPWSTIRNIPLIIQGLGVAYLILRDAAQRGDKLFAGIGVSILVSYACYLPVILFVQRAPLIGMLMIPKTMAYVAIAILAYRGMYRAEGREGALRAAEA
jgi:hypothetical protein